MVHTWKRGTFGVPILAERLNTRDDWDVTGMEGEDDLSGAHRGTTEDTPV